ncbi:MAG: hypothetical protein DYG98_26310 [Haliscomenobacteraceae bacterium CHB4]|nr:hypothetical protein [Saprospiraceae bacterium]MCE7926574.1 hypothetical protein [Haliscomenobacteraceae bacterium CHB4]
MIHNSLTVNENEDQVMNAKQGTILIAAQMAGLLERLDEVTFTRPLPLFHGSTIGQHFRHILEFYTCLFEGVLPARVDYSGRKRNHAISEKPGVALAVLDYIADAVKRQDEHQWLNVESEFSDEVVAHVQRPVYMSSMGRELQYAFDHAVHHLAIIRMGLEVYFPEIQVDEDLGVAPSTLKYKKEGRKIRLGDAIPKTVYG